VAAAAFNKNSERPNTSMDSTGPSTYTSKEEKHPSSPDDIRPLPKAGPRNSQNVIKKKRTTAILTDNPVKNSLKNYKALLGEKPGPGNEEKEVCATFLVRESQKKHLKTSIRTSKNASDTKEKDSKDIVCMYCLDAYSRSTS
jgi:hypothetical protein